MYALCCITLLLRKQFLEFRKNFSSDRTLSLKCPCGYVKHDVMHLGVFEQHEKRQLLDSCWTILRSRGGLWIVNTGDGDGVSLGVSYRKCGHRFKILQFHCSFCNRVTNIGVEERVAKQLERKSYHCPNVCTQYCSVCVTD